MAILAPRRARARRIVRAALLYMAGGAEHVQTSLEIAIVGSAGRPFLAHGLPFGAVVDGCLVASADAG